MNYYFLRQWSVHPDYPEQCIQPPGLQSLSAISISVSEHSLPPELRAHPLTCRRQFIPTIPLPQLRGGQPRYRIFSDDPRLVPVSVPSSWRSGHGHPRISGLVQPRYRGPDQGESRGHDVVRPDRPRARGHPRDVLRLPPRGGADRQHRRGPSGSGGPQ